MQPFVALESTVISHGLPHPQNVKLAHAMEAAVREAGAQPRTVGVIGGELVAGLSSEQIHYLATADSVHKLSRRDLPLAVARSWDGATTVATTMWIAHRAGIEVFATGGIGGVHRSAGGSPNGARAFDISADLQELAQTPVVVVCAGAKAILDLPATLEYLETHGVTVLGWETNELPAFYSRTSGLPVDACVESGAEVAAVWRAKRALGLPGGLLVTAPVPDSDEIPAAEVAPLIERALADADTQGLRSAEVTPFLLSRLAELSGERSVRTNVSLLLNNARIAGEIAVALAAES